MSKEALAKVVQRAISDAAFRRQLNSDPAGALRGFDLSADEASAIRTGDAGRLSTLGVDQRMSKSFALGGLASTRMAASDLTPGGGPALVDDLSGSGGRTIIPADPTRPGGSDDIDGGGTTGTSTVHAGDDYKFAGKVAPESTGTVRVGDDWKYTDRAAQDSTAVRSGDDWKFTDRAQGSAAPVDGSPEATAAENASGGGMAAYPEHYGLAGPSGVASVRAGDDWARTSSSDEAGRAGSARLDDSAGADQGSRLAKLDESFSGGNPTIDASTAGADPGARLAKLDEMFSGGNPTIDASTAADPGARLAKLDETFSGGNAAADTSGGSTPTTAYVDESEAYLTKVGYDSTAEVTDAHDRGTWSGDDIAGPTAADTDTDPNADTTGDGSSITP
ncbi:MAG TPA: Os1348 family NHLP clan protein [Candidatus Limnocylindria bacterium]|jgi:hypothetical protein|nr:Os1348 family NHLP clan protein [Candidatus Limnocylindria bacterium]